MILADTSIWADHLRRNDTVLGNLLSEGKVLMHPFVLGEIAMGFIRKRRDWLVALGELPSVHVADPEEVLALVEGRHLIGTGVGYVDAHLLATAVVTQDCMIWTRDSRFRDAAVRLGVAANPTH
jgi:predicted nucleic acid-binding protein